MSTEQDKGQMSDREAMKLALEALKASHPISNTDKSLDKHSEAMFALRQALEQKPWDTTDMAHRAGGLSMGQEPVTWRNAAIRLGEDLYSVGPNGYYDMTASQWLDWALSVVNTVPPNSTTDVVEPEACIVGIKGSAYDPIDTKRAYTYANQPGNVVAYKLGRASSSASLQRAGDFIDSGLILLKELQVEGYGVFDIGAEYTAPPKREWVGLTDEEEIELDEKYGDDFNAYIDARDTKLKEKNHD